MMPYIMTTKHLTPDGLGVTKRNAQRTFATLERARYGAESALIDYLQRTGEMPAREFLLAARGLPETGGTVGPLPDRTLIEVERISIERDQEVTALCADYGRRELAGRLLDAEAKTENVVRAARWVLACYDAKIAGQPVRGLGEAWEGLRHVLALSREETPHV